jgi:transposase-like protein
MVTPAAKRATVVHAIATFDVSQRRRARSSAPSAVRCASGIAGRMMGRPVPGCEPWQPSGGVSTTGVCRSCSDAKETTCIKRSCAGSIVRFRRRPPGRVLVDRRTIGIALQHDDGSTKPLENRRILAESAAPGASVSVVVRRHDINANMLFTWRHALGARLTVGSDPAAFVPAVMTAEEPASSPPASAHGGALSRWKTAPRRCRQGDGDCGG